MMKPEDITRLANREKGKARAKKKQIKKKPFNPFDWFEFPKTRKWFNNNFHFSNLLEQYLLSLLMLLIVFGAFWLNSSDNESWEFYVFTSLSGLFLISLIAGLVYAYIQKRKN